MKEILDYTFKILNYKPTQYELEKYNNFIFDPNDLFLITEKNVIKNSQEDNYNFGNYYNLKEKDSLVVNIPFTNDFLSKYASNDEKNYLEYLQNKKIDLEYINKFLIIYNNIKFIKIKQSFNLQNDINNYIFN